MSRFHIAQVNIGRLAAPLDDPRIDDFRNNLERINLLAESQPGFVWRAKDDSGGAATDIRISDNPLDLLNASVWESVEQLAAFVYRTDHVHIFRRGHEFFERSDVPIAALWWIPAGHVPPVAECLERLEHLRAHGPTPHAFDFRNRFPARDAAADGGIVAAS